MGIPPKTRDLTGSVPKELLEQGLLGRGIIVSVKRTGLSTGSALEPAQVCVFTVEVTLDKLPRSIATCRQAIRATLLPQLMMPGTTVAVRVDAVDRRRIALSLAEDPPAVRIASEF